MPTPFQQKISSLVLHERVEQTRKWGDQSFKPDEMWMEILGEEIGELADGFLNQDRINTEDENIQSQAVLMAWQEAVYLRELLPTPSDEIFHLFSLLGSYCKGRLEDDPVRMKLSLEHLNSRIFNIQHTIPT